jgi:hypothetical protein
MSEADSTSRRRPPTIDLTAKEVEAASPDPGAAADPGSAADSASAADAGSATSASQDAPEHRGTSSWRALPYLIGIAAGAVGVVAIAAALWFAGLVSVYDLAAPQSTATAPPAGAPQSAASTPNPQGAEASATKEISARLDRIEQALQGPPRTDAALARRVAAAEAQSKALADSLTAVTRRVDEIAAAAQAALVQAKSAATTADVAKNATQSSTEAGVQRSDVDALESRVAALQNAMKSLDADLAQRTSSSNANDRAIRLAIAAEALRGAAERGAPFQAELATVKALGADANAIARLEPFAAQGVTSTAELGREIKALTPALYRAIEPEPSNNSILGKIESQAQKLVRITPVGTSGAPAGDDPAALIVRLNADAAGGDIDAALAEIAKLPDPARALVQAWANKASARRAALAESRHIAAAALAALAKPDSQ